MKLFAPEIDVEERPDGTQVIRNRAALNGYPKNIRRLIEDAAAASPDRVFAAERDANGAWTRLQYRDLLANCRSLGTGLFQHGLGPERPLMAMASNSLDHLRLSLAAQYAGIPYAPVTPAYALLGDDRTRLRHVMDVVRPGAIFLDDADRFRAVLPLVRESGASVVTAAASSLNPDIIRMEQLGVPADVSAMTDAHPDALAKILFTSGSTGLPKAVMHTHRMMMANIEMTLQAWPDLRGGPAPVLVDWLPWNHCFGGNNNINLVLRLRGTLHIDEGRPLPGQFDTSIRNLREIPPTFYFNVPSGYLLLADALDRDTDLRRRFFSRLQGLFFAGAAMDESLWSRLKTSAVAEGRDDVPILSGWGATETGPTATLIQGGNDGVGNIGLPVPGVTLKLVPIGGKHELRVKSPSVTSGYLRAPRETASAFDAEGFYCTGDAGRWLDRQDHARGIVFDGRLNDDFKLANGTWVSFAPLRASIVALADCIKDVVICGHDRAYLAAMIWFKDGVTADQKLYMSLRQAVDRHNERVRGTSQRIERFSIQQEPLSFDAGEITEKGTVNQRVVRERRHVAVEALYT